ncbi:hypothetical protein [Sphingomonas bacterium]|uniref:hypothetical protein n=1 Tax=Sphingomonas bacterium TaxID=1895847 RepID=UPI001575F9F7|nr:hypothetical protein [Sphingomonas bacterium]
MSHRIFAQLEFERALGHAAIKALKAAVDEKNRFDAETAWPKETLFQGRYDVDALAAELAQIVEDRMADVLNGPGLRVIERDELFHEPEIVELVLAAREAR